MLELNRAYNMDCMEGMAQFPDGYFDLAVCDPPYGVKYARGKNGWGVCDNRPERAEVAWDGATPGQEYFTELLRVAKKAIVWGGNYFTDKLPVSKCWLVWDKICQTENKSVYADCELAWTNFTGVCRMYKLRQMGFISDTHDEKRIHPTQKPTELYGWIYEKFARPGYKILDTHLGSGSSRIAAYDAGLDFIGFETNKKYYDAQEQRFEEYTSQLSMFKMGCDSYAD